MSIWHHTQTLIPSKKGETRITAFCSTAYIDPLLHNNASNFLIPECLFCLQGLLLVENFTCFLPVNLFFLVWAESTTDCGEQIFRPPNGFIDLISVVKYQFKNALSYANILFCRETGSLTRLITSLKENVFGSPKELLKLSVPSVVYALQNNMAFVALSNLDAAVYQVIHVSVSNRSGNIFLFPDSWGTRVRYLSAWHAALSSASVLKAKLCFVIFRAYTLLQSSGFLS